MPELEKITQNAKIQTTLKITREFFSLQIFMNILNPKLFQNIIIGWKVTVVVYK